MHPNAKWHDILQYISVGLFISVSVSQATASTTNKTAPRRPAKSNADSTAPQEDPKKGQMQTALQLQAYLQKGPKEQGFVHQKDKKRV